MKDVYVLRVDWADDDEYNVDVMIYTNEKAAYNAYYEEIMKAIKESYYVSDVKIEGGATFFDVWENGAAMDFHKYITLSIEKFKDEEDLALTIID